MPRVVFQDKVSSTAERVRIVETTRRSCRDGQLLPCYAAEVASELDATDAWRWEPLTFGSHDALSFLVDELGRRCAAEVKA